MCARMAGPKGTSSRALCQHELPLQKDLSGSLPRCVLSRKVSFPSWVLSSPIKQQTSSGMTSSPEVPDALRKGMAPLLCSEETESFVAGPPPPPESISEHRRHWQIRSLSG